LYTVSSVHKSLSTCEKWRYGGRP